MKKITLVNSKITYQNRISGSTTYQGNLILENIEYKDAYNWAKIAFKDFTIQNLTEDFILLTDVKLRAGIGYNVWRFAVYELEKMLNIPKDSIYFSY